MKTGISLRVWGWNIKPCIYNEAKKCGVNFHNRIVITSLLTLRRAARQPE